MKTLVLDIEGLDKKEIAIVRNLVSVMRNHEDSGKEAREAFLSAAGAWKDLVPEDLASQLMDERHSSERKEVDL